MPARGLHGSFARARRPSSRLMQSQDSQEQHDLTKLHVSMPGLSSAPPPPPTWRRRMGLTRPSPWSYNWCALCINHSFLLMFAICPADQFELWTHRPRAALVTHS